MGLLAAVAQGGVVVVGTGSDAAAWAGAMASLLAAVAAVTIATIAFLREGRGQPLRGLDETNRMLRMADSAYASAGGLDKWRTPEMTATIANALLSQLKNVVDLTADDRKLIDGWAVGEPTVGADLMEALRRARKAVEAELDHQRRPWLARHLGR